jgi:hypothetical protein
VAALRRQSGHRQSPLSPGIGSRTGSAAHQQSADPVQANPVPHREQTRFRGGVGDASVIARTAL